MRFFLILIVLTSGASAFAGTNPFSCYDSSDNKVIGLETIEDQLVQGRIWSQPIEAIEDIGDGIIKAKGAGVTLVILGLFQKAVLVDASNHISADLICRPGR